METPKQKYENDVTEGAQTVEEEEKP